MNHNDHELKTVAILAIQSPVLSSGLEDWQRLADRLQTRLQHPIAIQAPASREETTATFESTLEWYTSQGYQRCVILPIGVGAFDELPLRTAIAWLGGSKLPMSIYVAQPWSVRDWAEAIAPSTLDAFAKSNLQTGSHPILRARNVLLVTDPAHTEFEVGHELATLAHEFVQHASDIDVQYAFTHTLRPSFGKRIQELQDKTDSGLMVIPWRMDQQAVDQMFDVIAEVDRSQDFQLAGSGWLLDWSAKPKRHAIDLLDHSSVIHVLVEKYLDALAGRSLERYIQASSGDAHTSDPIIEPLRELDRRIDEMLPSEYRGRTDEVSPQSMGTASLKLDGQGRVAWDEIWTSFCDLAMAGGPPHRGKLLEAVTRDDVEVDLTKYEAVVHEICRGIEMVTGLATHPSPSLGWVGVTCDSEAMAVWLLRAIIVENVMVRREGATIYLPAGPHFEIKREIKNVITSVAKTVHYWRAHLKIAGSL